MMLVRLLKHGAAAASDSGEPQASLADRDEVSESLLI